MASEIYRRYRTEADVNLQSRSYSDFIDPAYMLDFTYYLEPGNS